MDFSVCGIINLLVSHFLATGVGIQTMWRLFAGLIICIYSRFIEPYILLTPIRKVRLRGLHKELSGMKIAHLSDIHGRLNSSGAPVLECLKKVNPDVVVITGDFVERETEIERVTQGISCIAERYPTFYVVGNNDYPEWQEEFRKRMSRAGAVLLLNDNVRIMVRGIPVTIIGTDDPVYGKPDMQKALCGVEKQDLKILIAHSFSVLQSAADAKIDLVLAGHTHGGQLLFPLFIALHKVFGKSWAGHTSGWQRQDDTLCFISRGIGCSTVKVRFLSFPEMPIIVLDV
jgi:predicted MPP superfamily phosphohydrolase